jgi:MFS family permease
MGSEAEEGGFGATVAALAVGQLLCWAALYYAFSSFVLPMQRELGWDKPTLMGAFTLGLTVNGATTYAVGAAIDRGRGRLVLSGGALLAGLGFFGWALVSRPWMLYATWALLGAAMAMTLYEPAFNVLTKRYPTRFRDAITRLTLVGGFASTLCYPAVAALMAAFGWRGALWSIGAVLLFGVAPLHAWALRGPALPRAAARHDASADSTLRQALREPAFWLLTLTFTVYAFVSAAFWAHVMPALADKGFGEAESLTVLVWFGPAQVAGRFVHALAGRGVPLRGLGVVVLLAVPAALVCFALGQTVAALIAFAVLFGVANGLVTIVRGALVPEYFGRSHIGRISGAMSAVGLLSRAAAPLGAALLLLVLAGYREVMLALAALALVSAAAFAAAKRPRQRI